MITGPLFLKSGLGAINTVICEICNGDMHTAIFRNFAFKLAVRTDLML